MYIIAAFMISLFTIPIKGADLYTIFAPGIVDKASQVCRFDPAITTDQDHTKSVTFADTVKETGYGINRLISEITTLTKKPVNRSKMHMAGPADMQTLHEMIATTPADAHKILYGCSRGAATSINLLGKENSKNIVALILDASPASMPATIDPLLAKLGVHHSCDSTIFSSLFPAYSQNATTPLQSIKNIKNKNLPILLIHSQNDSKVPYSHSLQLYKEFVTNNFKHVYLVTIPQGRHAFLLQDPQIKDIYLQAVHSFYKKYNLPYNDQYAQNDMMTYQPDIADVTKKISELEEQLKKEYEASKRRNLVGISLICAMMLSYLMYKNLN